MTARDIDWGITYRHALAVCRYDTDPEDLAGAVVEELWRAIQRGKIAAPSRAAVRQARRNVWSRSRSRRYRRYWEQTSAGADLDRIPAQSDRDQIDVAWARMALARAWPMLTERERDGVSAVLTDRGTPGAHSTPRSWRDVVEAVRNGLRTKDHASV